MIYQITIDEFEELLKELGHYKTQTIKLIEENKKLKERIKVLEGN